MKGQTGVSVASIPILNPRDPREQSGRVCATPRNSLAVTGCFTVQLFHPHE